MAWKNGRVTQFTKNGVTNTCEYNANGIRVKKVANGLSHEYYLEDKKIVREVVTGTSAYELYYMYGTNGIVGFTQIKNGVKTNYYYRKNLQGDIVAVYGENGAKYAEYAYDAWGNCTILSDTNGIGALNSIRYRGYYYDVESGLYYLQSRYYDPTVGVFLSMDSAEYLVPEEINGVDLYAYCRYNPVMYVDPTGKFFVSLLIAVLAGAVIGGLLGGIKATIEGDSFWSGFVSGAIVGGALGGALILGGATMLAIAGKAVTGFIVASTFTAKLSLLVGSVSTAFVITAGAGMGAYAIKESMNGRAINTSEMLRQGLMTGLKGVGAFATGMMLATTGVYNYLLEGVKWTLAEKMKMMVIRSITSFVLQCPWKFGLN